MTEVDEEAIEEAKRHLRQLLYYQESDDISKETERARVRMALVCLGGVVTNV